LVTEKAVLTKSLVKLNICRFIFWNGRSFGVLIMEDNQQNIIIYNTKDGKASVFLHAEDCMVRMNQNQIVQLFDTSKQNIGQHISNVLKEEELEKISVVKNYFTTASDGKDYNVSFTGSFLFGRALSVMILWGA